VTTDDGKPVTSTNWVVVTFGGTDKTMPSDLMGALFDTEIEADAALQESGLGWIDGNETGDHQYDLYFAGDDRHAMWAALEPIFAAAPVRWSSVELRDGLEDEYPELLEPS
jgi:hypothetical protein